MNEFTFFLVKKAQVTEAVKGKRANPDIFQHQQKMFLKQNRHQRNGGNFHESISIKDLSRSKRIVFTEKENKIYIDYVKRPLKKI